MLVNIHDAKTNFSKFVNQALKGEEVIIAKNGIPLIRLVPYTEDTQIRHGGQFQGLIKIAEDFDAPLPEDLLKQFYEDER